MLSFHRPTDDAEWYAYSAAWLLFGTALLAGGLRFRSSALRHASLAVVLVATAKVFLFDMAALTGLYRAVSFLGLGAALIGIGFFYQKVVFPAARPEAGSRPPAG